MSETNTAVFTVKKYFKQPKSHQLFGLLWKENFRPRTFKLVTLNEELRDLCDVRYGLSLLTFLAMPFIDKGLTKTLFPFVIGGRSVQVGQRGERDS